MVLAKCKNIFDYRSYQTIIKEKIDSIKLFRSNPHSFSFRSAEKVEDVKKILIHNIKYWYPEYEKSYKEVKNLNMESLCGRRYKYKNLKKELFQWNGPWSNHDLYYKCPHLLKLKMSNHFTKSFSKPILKTIPDIDFYLPKSSKFDKSQIFLENDSKNGSEFEKTNISLDIESILGYKEPEEIVENKLERNIFKEIQKFNNKSNFQILSNFHENRIKFQSNIYFDDFLCELNNQTVFECCLVKLSHHVRGIFYIKNNQIIFEPYYNQFKLYTYNEDFDKERKTCYGSSLTIHNREKDKVRYIIDINEIYCVLKKKYYYKRRGIEISCNGLKSYFFNFKSHEIRDLV